MALLELIETDVAAKSGVEVNVQALALVREAIDILVDDAGWQAESGNPPDHHATEAVTHFVDVDGVAGDAQVVRRCQPGGAGADNADGLLLRYRHRRWIAAVSHLIHDKALEIANLQRSVTVGAAARRLAGGITDAAADGAEGIGRGNRLEGLFVFALPDLGDVGGGVGADRTGDLTRCGHKVDVAGVILSPWGRVGHLDSVQVVNGHLNYTIPKGWADWAAGRSRYPGSYGKPVTAAASGVRATRSSRPSSLVSE